MDKEEDKGEDTGGREKEGMGEIREEDKGVEERRGYRCG